MKDYNWNIQKQLVPLTKTYKKILKLKNISRAMDYNYVTPSVSLYESNVFISRAIGLNEKIEKITITGDSGILVNDGFYMRIKVIPKEIFRSNRSTIKHTYGYIKNFRGTVKELRGTFEDSKSF